MKSARLLAICFTLAAAANLVAVSQLELSTLKARASVGDNSARYKLGVIHELAATGPADAEKPLEYFRAGAEAGHAACMGKYAIYQLEGLGSLKKDQSAGVRTLQAAAALKDPDTLAMLAQIHFEGWYGVTKDAKMGAKYLEAACELKSAMAYSFRAGAYEYGLEGYPKDAQAAKRDILACALAMEATAADLDAPVIQKSLYHAYAKAERFNDARKWLDKAIQAGSYAAISERGISHMLGSNGETKDLVQAYAYFNLAASIRPEPFPKASSMIAENRDMLAKEMTGAQIAEAQRLSTEMNAKLRR